MKSNWIKYIFIIFTIIVLGFAVFKFKTEEKQRQVEQEQSQNQETLKKREMKLAIAQMDTINPILSKNKNVQDVTKLIFEPLLTLTPDYKIEPALAKECKKKQNNIYLIKLRENVRWSNGQRFTAEDVKFTLDRLKDTQSIYSANVQNVVGITIQDDYTIQLQLDKEVPFFEYNLTFPILSKDYFEGEDFINTPKNSNPIGTGMLKITDVQGSFITLEKNTYWWNKEKNVELEKVTVNLYSSIGELYNSFKLGNIDLITSTNYNLQQYIGTIGYNAKELKGREHTYIAINTLNDLTQKQEVRKAILYSIDKENIVSTIFNNKAIPSSFPLDYGNRLAEEQNVSSGYNPDKAKQVLEENGWKFRYGKWQKSENYKTKTLALNMIVKDYDANQINVAENIKKQLSNSGINITISKLPDAEYRRRLTEKQYDLAICQMTLSPSPNIETFVGPNNLSNYNNEEMNKMLEEAKNTQDENKLKEIYKRIIEKYKSDVPCISLYNNKYIVAYSNEIVGEVTPNWFYQYYNMETWYK